MFICGVSDMNGYKDKKHSLIGQVSMSELIWRELVVENETEAVIGLFHERNLYTATPQKKLTNTASPQEKSTKHRHCNTYFHRLVASLVFSARELIHLQLK